MKLELGKLKERWTSTNQEPQAALDDQTFKGLLTEYNALRNEILNAQGRRMQIISFTVGAFGVILSITGNNVLGSASMEPERRLWVAIGGMIAVYAIVIAGLNMMIMTQQLIERLGGYIRIFIEPRMPGLNWECHWRDFGRHRHKGGHKGMGGFYYLLSTLPLLLPTFALSQHKQGWPAALILIPFASRSIYLSYVLHTGKSKGWKEWARWENYDDKHTTNTQPPLAPKQNQTPDHDTAPEQTD